MYINYINIGYRRYVLTKLHELSGIEINKLMSN